MKTPIDKHYEKMCEYFSDGYSDNDAHSMTVELFDLNEAESDDLWMMFQRNHEGNDDE